MSRIFWISSVERSVYGLIQWPIVAVVDQRVLFFLCNESYKLHGLFFLGMSITFQPFCLSLPNTNWTDSDWLKFCPSSFSLVTRWFVYSIRSWIVSCLSRCLFVVMLVFKDWREENTSLNKISLVTARQMHYWSPWYCLVPDCRWEPQTASVRCCLFKPARCEKFSQGQCQCLPNHLLLPTVSVCRLQ